ncbi:MAG: thiamine phosphate synthase [Bacteroidia bacterium]
MKLVAISSSKNTEKEIQIITSLFENGLNCFHLRKPDMNTKDMATFIEKIPAHFHNRIVIHSHHQLAGTFGLKGIHLTRIHRRRKISTWFRLRLLRMNNGNTVVSTTFHKLGNVYQNNYPYSYAFLGNIFDGISGTFSPGFNEHSLKAINEKSRIPLIARGGTNAENIALLKDLGFAGAALYGCIWKREDPVKAYTGILERMKQQGLPAL